MQRSFEWFENNVIFRVPPNYPGAGRRVYPGFLQHAGFMAMNPDRHASSHYDYFKDLVKGDESSAETHRKFYDEYNAVLDMDADYYLETIKTVFQEFHLVHGTWDVRSPEGKLERVRPQDITTTALQTVEGELDDISGAGQTRAAHSLCEKIQRREGDHLEVKGAGHYGIFSGRRWRTVVYPQVKAFIADQHAKAALIEQVTTPAPVAAARARAADQAADHIQLTIDPVEGSPEETIDVIQRTASPTPRPRNGADRSAKTGTGATRAPNGAAAPAQTVRANAKKTVGAAAKKAASTNSSSKAAAQPTVKPARKPAAKSAP
jgi:poly(3-hydroxybutyrate) depolymerase